MNDLILALFANFLLETIADSLNLTRLKGALPKEFEGIYSPEKYQKSIQYQRECTYFGFIHDSVNFFTLIAFIALGGFQSVDHWARGFRAGPILTGLIFGAGLSVLKAALQLPFSIYSTFVIETKYGFNKLTPLLFLQDLVKGTLLGAVLGSGVFAALIYFFDTAGPLAWLYCWIGLSTFQILLSYLAPAIIMPLFNKFEPLPKGALRTAIESYAKTRNFRLNGIFSMDGSKRSTKSNAFFSGFGKLRKLVLFDNLIANQSTPELVAVLAHEIGHFEKKHIIKSMMLSIISSGLILYVYSLFLRSPKLFQAFGMTTPSSYAGLILLSIVSSPVMRIFSIGVQKLSRIHEFEADRFASETYGQPEALISALKKLSVDHLSHLDPHPLKVALDYSHPPVLERIEAIRRPH